MEAPGSGGQIYQVSASSAVILAVNLSRYRGETAEKRERERATTRPMFDYRRSPSTTAARHRGAPAPKRTDARESLFSKAVVYTFVIHYTRARRPKLRAHSPLVGERRRGINLEL